MLCVVCGKNFEDRSFRGKRIEYCSRKCYDRLYWQTHKDTKSDYFKQRHKETYKPHPKPLKYENEKERDKARREYAKEYYHSHKDYYRQKQREFYEKHKDDPIRLEKHRAAMRKYYYKMKGVEIMEKINYDELKDKKICSICFRKYNNYGNNAWPINLGRCCDDCNEIVIKSRINLNFIK